MKKRGPSRGKCVCPRCNDSRRYSPYRICVRTIGRTQRFRARPSPVGQGSRHSRDGHHDDRARERECRQPRCVIAPTRLVPSTGLTLADEVSNPTSSGLCRHCSQQGRTAVPARWSTSRARSATLALLANSYRSEHANASLRPCSPEGEQWSAGGPRTARPPLGQFCLLRTPTPATPPRIRSADAEADSYVRPP